MKVLTLSVVTEKLDKMPFTLRRDIASATLPDESEIYVEQAIGTGTLYLQHDPTGPVYQVTMEALCQAVLSQEATEDKV